MHSRYPEQFPSSPASRPYGGITTERIMRAVEQQRRITSQLEALQARQQARLARATRVGPKIIGAMFVIVGVITLGLFGLFVFQPDLFLAMLSFSSGVIDIMMQLARYLSTGLDFITRQSWLLSGAALVVVIMIGMWLHLMRTPQEA